MTSKVSVKLILSSLVFLSQAELSLNDQEENSFGDNTNQCRSEQIQSFVSLKYKQYLISTNLRYSNSDSPLVVLVH